MTKTPPPGLVVRYIQGFERPPKADYWGVKADADAVRIYVGRLDLFSNRLDWRLYHQEPWQQLRGIQVASKKATRANIPALALFGTMGLAAQQEPETLVAVSLSDRDVFFACDHLTLALQTAYARVVDANPLAAGKIRVDGKLVDSEAGPAGPIPVQLSVTARLREATALHEAGLICDEEYQSKRSELLQQL